MRVQGVTPQSVEHPTQTAGTASPLAAVPAAGTLAQHADLFLDRELSLLAFHRRVLALAADRSLPVLERLRFLTIVSSNLDEFFEIRVAGMREQLREQAPPAGATLAELRSSYMRVSEMAHAIVGEQYALYNREIVPDLVRRGVHLLAPADCTPAQQAWMRRYFELEVRPLLTPVGLDPAHPFPQIVNKSLNFIVELSGEDAFGRPTAIAIVRAPRVLPRVIEVPAHLVDRGKAFLLLSTIMQGHLGTLFAGREIVSFSQFRVTRDADLWLDEEEVKNLRQALQGELPNRHFGSAVRLEVGAACPVRLSDMLLQQFDLTGGDLYGVDGPVNLVRSQQLIECAGREDLEYPPFKPGLPRSLEDRNDLFAAIRRQDILLHHPYQSFQPVIDFIVQAATDPQVVAIKQTVYRAGSDSQLMEALIEAARQGKEVTLVVELRARFDEEANMNWAERFEQAGAQVVYGVFGLKTHAKLALVIRREEGLANGSSLRMYAHLGTGNYNLRTARQYTDFGLMTANPEVCADVNEVFLHVTSLGKPARLRHLWLAPFTLQRRLLKAIRREQRLAEAGKPARIVAKMNALFEESTIRALYAASSAGVKIDLVVRGGCALRPGVPGTSENIRVRSVLGRFLEHSRIYHFHNDGNDEVWLSSADWMGRNLFRRIEVAFPVLDPLLRERVIREGLQPYLEDNVAAWELKADGEWKRPAGGEPAIEAQEVLMKRLAGQAIGDG